MNIKLHIDRLILEGLPVSATDGKTVRGAVESELTRLLTSGGVSESLHAGAIPQVRANGLQYSPHAGPEQLGRQIANSLYGGIGKAK
jgi:hypothetical protein